jgi:catechol 2,3-dioxygenase-like lactoylglutathione lyase family enzyme
MTVMLDHTIVPSRNPGAAAQALADLLGVSWETGRGHFTPVYVNDGLTFDFAKSERFETHHYCFRTDEAEFDAIFARVQAAGIQYRSRPQGPTDLQLNTARGGRNFYWTDDDGHVWEVLTVSYARKSGP